MEEGGGAVIGLDGIVVQVEVDTGRGLPSFVIVGLPDAAVQESRERVQAAVKNAGFHFPNQRVTVNLAPQGNLTRPPRRIVFGQPTESIFASHLTLPV